MSVRWVKCRPEGERVVDSAQANLLEVLSEERETQKEPESKQSAAGRPRRRRDRSNLPSAASSRSKLGGSVRREMPVTSAGAEHIDDERWDRTLTWTQTKLPSIMEQAVADLMREVRAPTPPLSLASSVTLSLASSPCSHNVQPVLSVP